MRRRHVHHPAPHARHRRRAWSAQGGRLLVGFARKPDEQAHAEAKLEKKNFDFIVLNSLRDAGAGFRGDTNR